MKKILFISTVVLLLLSSCGGKESELQNATFSSLYDELIMQHASLDSVSNLTNVPKDELIRMRYGLIKENLDLTETLREILIACRQKDVDKLNSIKERKEKKALVHENGNIDITADLYESINLKRNKKFGEKVPEIISNFVNEKVDNYIESKYTLFTVLPNTWNYYTKSDEDFANDFLKDLSISDLSSKCENYYIERINNYKNVICEESEIIAKKLYIPDFTVIPGENTIEIDNSLKQLIIERTKSQIREISHDIFWDIIIVLVVSLIFSYLVGIAIDEARDQAIKDFLKNVRWKENNGILKNIVRTTLYAVGAYGQYEEEVNSIRAKYKVWKYITDICIFIISFVISWFLFIVPQLRMEGDINAELTTKIIESSNTLNIKPERIIDRYLNIEESGVKGESVVDEDEISLGQDTISDSDYRTDISETLENGEYNFIGRIGNNDIKLKLAINNSTNEIIGEYIYYKNGKPYSTVLKLNGMLSNKGDYSEFTLDETTQNGRVFSLMFRKNIIQNT